MAQERYQFETQWSRDRNANGISTIKCVCHASHVCYVAGVSNLAWMRAENTRTFEARLAGLSSHVIFYDMELL